MSVSEFDAPERGEQVPERVHHYDYADQTVAPEKFPEPEWSDQAPIPVYVVSEEETPEITRWSSSRVNVDDSRAQHLSGARRNRTRIVVHNDGTDLVYLGPTEQSVSAATPSAFALAANANVEMFHNDHVWAKCAATDAATVNVIEEYTVPLE